MQGRHKQSRGAGLRPKSEYEKKLDVPFLRMAAKSLCSVETEWKCSLAAEEAGNKQVNKTQLGLELNQNVPSHVGPSCLLANNC